MAVTTLGRQAVRQVLPPKFKHYADETLTAKKQKELMTAIAKEDPDGYIDVLQGMNAIGQRVVSVYGKDTTITLDDVDSGAQIRNTRAKLNELIRTTINRKDLTPQQKQQKVIQLGYKYTAKMKDLGLQDANKRKTGLANQIASGSRGNPVQLMQLITGDMMMKDAMNRDIPFLATMPYVEGDSPLAYWASAMSGRKSTYDVQAATGRVGYLSKQATNTTHSTPISMQDCGTTDTGVPVKAADSQNIGSILLYPWKEYKAGTPVTEDMIAEADDQDEFIIRSPVTCKAHSGVCAKCAGIQENGKLPAIGSYVALNSVKSFIEPLTQAGISCLHPDTKVALADGTEKRIQDIQVGDIVYGCDKEGNRTPVKVTRKFLNGIQPMYKFEMRTQDTGKLSEVVCTQQHKFLVYIEGEDTPRLLPIGTEGVVAIALAKAPGVSAKAYITGRQFVGNHPAIDIEVNHPDHLFQLVDYQVLANSKHGSGMGGTKQVSQQGEDQPTGFDSVQRMLLAPKVFPGGAVLATADGRVTEIRKAPQGGHYITVGSSTVYSPVARTVKVKVGDVVEAGDMLTNGVPNPMQIVKYKGIGQGRHYFTKKLSQILPKTGAGTLRRNLEEFSRAMINKVRITDPDGYAGYYPGDIADYDDIMDKWVPRDDSKQLSIKDSIGRYLEKPVLYYSIGTRITPSVAKKLQKYGTQKIVTNQEPPPFEPQFVPSKQFVMQDKNWLPRLSGERLKDTLFDAARKGITDRYDSPSFVDKIIVEPYNPAK